MAMNVSFLSFIQHLLELYFHVLFDIQILVWYGPLSMIWNFDFPFFKLFPYDFLFTYTGHFNSNLLVIWYFIMNYAAHFLQLHCMEFQLD